MMKRYLRKIPTRVEHNFSKVFWNSATFQNSYLPLCPGYNVQVNCSPWDLCGEYGAWRNSVWSSFSWCPEILSVGWKIRLLLRALVTLDGQMVLWVFYFSVVHNSYTLLSPNCCCHIIPQQCQPNWWAELIAGCLHSNPLRMFYDIPVSPWWTKAHCHFSYFNICLPQMVKNWSEFRKYFTKSKVSSVP